MNLDISSSASPTWAGPNGERISPIGVVRSIKKEGTEDTLQSFSVVDMFHDVVQSEGIVSNVVVADNSVHKKESTTVPPISNSQN